MDIIEKMHSTKLYLPSDPEIAKEQQKCLNRLYDFNQTRPTELKKREAMLKEMFAEIGDGCYIEPPFHANWGGRHVHFGNHVYANFNLTLVDDTHIYIGSHTMIGRYNRHGRSSRSADFARAGVSVQRADTHRQQLLAWRRSDSSSRRHHRR